MDNLITSIVGKWVWSGDGETFNSATFDSEKEALADAFDNGERRVEIYVGQVNEFRPEVDAGILFDDIAQQASDEVGEASDGYLDHVTTEQQQELSNKLTEIFNEWASKYKHTPDFYAVENVHVASLAEVQ